MLFSQGFSELQYVYQNLIIILGCVKHGKTHVTIYYISGKHTIVKNKYFCFSLIETDTVNVIG